MILPAVTSDISWNVTLRTVMIPRYLNMPDFAFDIGVLVVAPARYITPQRKHHSRNPLVITQKNNLGAIFRYIDWNCFAKVFRGSGAERNYPHRFWQRDLHVVQRNTS